MSEHQTQEYRGNGKHQWEGVISDGGFQLMRLRVPGGWLYRDQKTQTVTLVPMPEVVKHKV